MQTLLPSTRNDWRLLITEKSFTRVNTAISLAEMQVYNVGPTMSHHRDFCKDLYNNKRPRKDERGTSAFAIAEGLPEGVPSMVAVAWVDNEARHFLATGASTNEGTLGKCHSHVYLGH
jgi:hypothetical protein